MPEIKHDLSHPKYRPDIDGLRAVAVLAVVVFHAFPSWMTGGFIGVDVFFVISGYLISTILFKSLDRGAFSFTQFYSRRIRRIFPALTLVLVVCFAFGWFYLLADEYKQLGKFIAAGAGFVSNVILWMDAGYFDNSSDTKPLLHLWSLGIEEQFYIVWPLLLWLAWKRKFNLFTITVLVGAISFALNLKGVKEDGIATFYSPQTRFWELLAGSLLAWATIYREKQEKIGAKLANALSLSGSALLAYGFWRINKDLFFPGGWAIIPVAGGVLIIAAGPKAWINRCIFSNRIAVWFGLISFPLYLWHWPLLSFARIIESETPSIQIRISLVLISIMLAWVTYRLVERPIRFGGCNKVITISLIGLLAGIGYIGFNTYERNGLPFRPIEKNNIARFLNWPHWDNAACTAVFGISPCQVSTKNPRLMILGDSHANHLYPGLAHALTSDFGVFVGGTCPPLKGVKLYVQKNQAAHPCAKIDYLNQNIQILDRNPSIKTVVISSFWRPILDGQIINDRERNFWGGVRLESDFSEEKDLPSHELVYRGLKRTISTLYNMKKDVIFIRDTPDFNLDIRDQCLTRFNLHSTQDCKLPRHIFEDRRALESGLIEKLLVDFPLLKVIDPFATFCTAEECFLVLNGVPLYRDQHHLSEYGSNLLANQIYKSGFIVKYR